MTKAPAPAKVEATPRPAPKSDRPIADHQPVFHSTKSLLDIPVSDPQGTSAERARAVDSFRGTYEPLPHRANIERSFGRDLSGVKAHVGSSAGHVARELGTNAFTMGEHVTFREKPDLRLAAHEAAHIIQQRSGLVLAEGVGRAGDAHERKANAIAARVVAGRSAADLLPQQTAAPRGRGLAPLQHDKGTATEDEIDDFYQGILQQWEEQARTLSAGPDRAEARRVLLLLSFPPDFTSYGDVDAFLTTCLATAKDETKTVETLKKDPSVDLDFFVDNGDAFPNWWADRINSELYGTSNEATLEARFNEARKEASVNAALLSDEIWWSGLPISRQQALQVQRASLPDLALSFENARKYPKERIGNYARLVVNWERTLSHWQLVHWYRFQLRVRIEEIRKGELVIDADNWRSVLATKFFNIKLRVFESAASTPDDMRAAFSALMLQRPTQFFRSSTGGPFQYKFPDEAVAMFWKEIQEVDQQLAATSGLGRVWKSWEWAAARSYFYEAFMETVEAVKEDWPWMVGRLVAVFIAQAIPGVNIAVDILLLIEFGFDGITAFLDLVDTFKSAYNATTVEAMQRAAAKMGASMFGIAAKVVKWALTAGARWTGKQWAKYRDAKKFLDEHGDTPETRDALAKAKGDANKAREHLEAKRQQERRAREKAAAEAKRAEEKKQRERDEAERQQQAREREQQQERERQQEVERQRAQRKADKDEELRKRREANPDWPVVGKKPVKPYIATDSHYAWKHSEGNFIDAKLNNGTLSATIKARGVPRARGSDLLNAAIKHFGADRIKRFQGEWRKGTDFEDNLNEYLKNLGGNHASAAARIEAARNTWTGRQMDRLGYKNITVPEHGPNPTGVLPVFSK